MNYYNPYFSMYPSSITNNTGLFGRLFNSINMSSILSGTQKTLNIVNQTIPLIKQATPIMRNAKTMFKVINEFKKIDTKPNKNTKKINNMETKKEPEYTSSYTSGPTFFV